MEKKECTYCFLAPLLTEAIISRKMRKLRDNVETMAE